MSLDTPAQAVLGSINDGIRRLASRKEGVLLADIAAHFAGHGLSTPPADRWYWPHMLIEPSARGASEIRRLWLRAVGYDSRPAPSRLFEKRTEQTDHH